MKLCCTCPCSDDEDIHDGSRCDIHGCFAYSDGSCDETPVRLRCADCPTRSPEYVAVTSQERQP